MRKVSYLVELEITDENYKLIEDIIQGNKEKYGEVDALDQIGISLGRNLEEHFTGDDKVNVSNYNKDVMIFNTAEALIGDSSDHYDQLRDNLMSMVSNDEWEELSYKEIYEKYGHKIGRLGNSEKFKVGDKVMVLKNNSGSKRDSDGCLFEGGDIETIKKLDKHGNVNLSTKRGGWFNVIDIELV